MSFTVFEKNIVMVLITPASSKHTRISAQLGLVFGEHTIDLL